MSITIEAKDAGKFLRKLDAAARARARTALLRGAQRGRAIMARRTPVDTGHMRARWLAHASSGANEAARLVNDHPMIGVIENGARPHPVSDVGILQIEQWVSRHPQVWQGAQDSGDGRLLTREAAIAKVAHGIVWKLRNEGQEPTHFIRDALPDLQRAMAREVVQMMRDLLKNPPGVD